MTNEEKVLQQIPFIAVGFNKIYVALKDELDFQELGAILSQLVAAGKIQMTMSPKGDPEYSRLWNPAIDEEKKNLTHELNKRFAEGTIFYPRYDSYVANLGDNFINTEYEEVVASFAELNSEYALWHRNAKTNNTYPPKMHYLASSNVLAANIVAGLELAPEQVGYALEYEVIEAEPKKDKPNEMDAPKVLLDAILNYEDAVDYLQADMLEHFQKPYRQSMWAYQFGDRYMFDDADATAKWREFAKKANYVYFNGYDVMKTLIAVYTDILATPEDYKNKKVNVLNVYFGVKGEAYPELSKFSAAFDEEAKCAEADFNALLETLPLPEGVTMSYQYLTVEDAAEAFENEEKKAYIKNRYLGF